MTNRLVFVSPKNPANGFQYQQQQQPQGLKSPKSPKITPTTTTTATFISNPLVEMFPPVGLVNTGATCFFNASLQCLFACPAFVSLLLTRDTTNRVERDILDLLALHLTTHVRKLPAGQGKRAAYPVHAIFKLFRQQSNGLIRTGRQEDSHEALVMLLDQMERALLRTNPHKYTPARNPINDVFGCTLHRHILCPTCKYESKPVEPNVVLSVEIKSTKGAGGNTAQQLIRNAFASTVMDKDNKWECGGCKKKVQAETFYSFASFPETLVLHLKRFAVNRMGREEKLKTPFFIEGSEELAFGEVQYELVGVLVHQGSRTSSGHYYSFVRINKAWYEADDEDVRRVSVQTVLKETQAYMLFYSRKPTPAPAKALDALQRIQHEKPSLTANSSPEPVQKKPRESLVVQAPATESKVDKTAKPMFKELVVDPLPPQQQQKPTSPAKRVKMASGEAFSPLPPSPLPQESSPVKSTTSQRSKDTVRRRFSSLSGFKRGLMWTGLVAKIPFRSKRSFTSTLPVNDAKPVKPAVEAVLPLVQEPIKPVPVVGAAKEQVQTAATAILEAPPSATSMESFLPTQFSFDIKPKKKMDFGDAWDEHLDRGKQKKVRSNKNNRY